VKIKSHAKINSFLKITGYKNGYHTLLSRFLKVPTLYDTISFVPQKCNSFTIEGFDNLLTESNIIYKAYKAMDIETDFFKYHKVVVQKNIPTGAGLGGGSSNAGTFMRLFNSVCELNISTKVLANIGSKVGADVPFFIYNYNSANVSGFGEVVEPFDEGEELDIEIYTPNIHCDTPLVYKTFRENLFDSIDLDSFRDWDKLTTKEILSKVDAIEANDLYRASLIVYPHLKDVAKEGWYFSGSGSSFFRIK
jgi:4-diphosphocytidyl-2-C-methyl-D-erythritol kinase